MLTSTVICNRTPSATYGSQARVAFHSPHSAERFSVRGRANLRGITIRAVRSDDRERIVKAFRALDPKSIYQRFFVFKSELSGEELRRLTESDGVRDVVLVATVASGNQEIIVGLGHYARNEASAEIAFTVEEDYQGRGIASELLRQLADIARRNGVPQFEADVLRDNAPMLEVFRRSGLPMKRNAGGRHRSLDAVPWRQLRERLGCRSNPALRPNSDVSVTTSRRSATTFLTSDELTPAMTLKSESTYPSRRTYVLKLRSDASAGALAGRLENLVTGGQREFASGHELLESIASDLGTSPAERSVDTTHK